MESDIKSLKEQLRYLVDELGAQRPLYSKVSDSILSEKPPGGKSIRDYYEELLIAERNFCTFVIGQAMGNRHDHRAAIVMLDIDALLQEIMEARSKSLACLPPDESEVWTKQVEWNGQTSSLLEWTYQAALRDADTLRSITMLLSEIRYLFKK